MKNKNVIMITGGSRGIGAATAQLAAARGYAVAVNYRHNKEAADAVVAAIAQAGGTAITLAGDVASEADVVHMFKTVDQAFGPLTALVNNAGGEPGRVERVKSAIPMQRGGNAIEVANAILWLLSDEASYTTGSFIDVAGGR